MSIFNLGFIKQSTMREPVSALIITHPPSSSSFFSASTWYLQRISRLLPHSQLPQANCAIGAKINRLVYPKTFEKCSMLPPLVRKYSPITAWYWCWETIDFPDLQTIDLICVGWPVNDCCVFVWIGALICSYGIKFSKYKFECNSKQLHVNWAISWMPLLLILPLIPGSTLNWTIYVTHFIKLVKGIIQ